jgi:hypothetical protein
MYSIAFTAMSQWQQQLAIRNCAPSSVDLSFVIGPARWLKTNEALTDDVPQAPRRWIGSDHLIGTTAETHSVIA